MLSRQPSSVIRHLSSLSLHNISVRFGALQALDDVSFSCAAGEVHALLGENGAGKTTLMRIAYGLLRPDQGEVAIALNGSSRTFQRGFGSPAEARAAGLGMVHQHFTSIREFTVAENIALAGAWKETGRAAMARAAELIKRVRLPLNPEARVELLSVAMRQRLEILKALAAEARVLLLDEPTAVLAPSEVGELQRAIEEFAATRGAVVLITHKLPEVFAMADRVTCLRAGRVVMSGIVAEQTRETLAEAMLGATGRGESKAGRGARSKVRGEELVAARELSLRLDGRVVVESVSFACRAGEITGVVAIEGNGQRELLRAIAGVGDAEQVAGTLRVSGPVAFIPDDRLHEALIPEFTLTENVLLGTLGEEQLIDWGAVRDRTSRIIGEFDVRAQGPDAPARTLSGGNQQKLVFGRAMARAPRVLVAEQPTRGLDLLATAAIHQRLRDAADAGIAVIVYGADLDEIVSLADQLLVVANGQVHHLPTDATREAIGDAMLGTTAG